MKAHHTAHHGVAHHGHHTKKHHAAHGVHEAAHHGVHGAPHVRKHRKTGGKTVESPMHGVDEAEMDLRDRPEEYNHSRVETEAEAKRRGGRAKRKHGGHVLHHHTGHVKHVGAVHGEHGKMHAGRKPRKTGGRASSDQNPFTSARHGTPAAGRKLEPETMG
jgi:hypothetical protein